MIKFVICFALALALAFGEDTKKEDPKPDVDLIMAELSALRVANEKLQIQVNFLQKQEELRDKGDRTITFYQQVASKKAEKLCKSDQSWSVSNGIVTCTDKPKDGETKKK